jgi:hypothetical protein
MVQGGYSMAPDDKKDDKKDDNKPQPLFQKTLFDDTYKPLHGEQVGVLTTAFNVQVELGLPARTTYDAPVTVPYIVIGTLVKETKTALMLKDTSVKRFGDVGAVVNDAESPFRVIPKDKIVDVMAMSRQYVYDPAKYESKPAN